MSDRAGKSRPNYTAKQFIAAIPDTGGIITTIAKKVGCDWHTAKKYIDNHPSVARAYADECEKIGDLAERGLFKAIKTEDLSAIKFYLTTKARGRGYAFKHEVEHSGEMQIVMGYIDVPNRAAEATSKTSAGEE